MGADLQLTGLASGFDWAPVVDQLIELERIPQKRLESEKVDNEEKMSDLTTLKSQLDTLNSANKALQNENLYTARKVTMDSEDAKVLSAWADAGALTGTFTVSVHSLSTQTEMNSKHRAPKGLGKTLNLSDSLKDLPLQTAITEGTFTISGKTFSIDNLNASLQDVMDMINAQMGGADGVNPEGDGTGITFEYDSDNDKMIVDGGEYAVSALNNVPVLGSPTDSSNFLKVLRLLNRQITNRAADWETGSGVSIWGAGNVATNPHLKSWIHASDSHEIANNAITSDDDRIYVGYDHDGDGKKTLYRRKLKEAEFNSAGTYNVGDKVYRNGFIYEAVKATPSSAWAATMGDVSGTTEVTHNAKNWRLMMDLETKRVGNDGTGTTQATFSDAVNAGQHTPVSAVSGGATGDADAIKQGDIVKGTDGAYFRALRDRTEDAENFGTLSDSFANLKSNTSWNTFGTGKFRPNHIYIDGRLYEANTSGGATYFGANNGFVEHGGATSQVNFAGDDLVVGQNGGAEDEQAFRARAKWDTIQALPGTAAAHTTLWQNGDFVKSMVDNNFYEGTNQWNNVNTHDITQNYSQNDYVHLNTLSKNFFQAKAAWDNVTNFNGTGLAISTGGASYNTNAYIRHTGTGNNQFYKSKGDWGTIAAKAEEKVYDTAGAPADAYARSTSGGSVQFWKAKSTWDDIRDNAYSESGRVNGFGLNLYRQLTSDGPANGRIYRSKVDLGNTISSHTNSTNYASGITVEDGTSGRYYKSQAQIADAATPTFATNVTSAQVEPMTTGQRILDTGTGVVYEATAATANVSNYLNSTRWTNGQVVTDSDNFWVADQDIADATFDSGTGLTGGSVTLNYLGLNTDQGNVYKATVNISGTTAFNSANPASAGALLKDGGNYYKFTNEFLGTFNDGDSLGGGTAAVGDLAFSANTNTFWTVGASSDTGNFRETESTLGAGDQWTNTGHATLNALVGSSATDETNDVLKPTGANSYWSAETAATTLANNAYWSPVSTLKQPATDGGTYWTVVGDATDPTASPGSNSYWTEVTDDVTLTGQDGSAASNDYWEDVTSSIVDFPSGSLITTFWDEVTDDITLTTDLAAGGSNVYWDEVTAELTDQTDSEFENTWWTDVGATLKDHTDTTWWTDVTNTLNTLGTNTWWSEITTELADPSDGGFNNWWTEIAHADTNSLNAAGGYDGDFWQLVTPDMKALTGSGASGAAHTNAVDHTIWAEMGNLSAYAGTDGKFGTHDSGEHHYFSTAAPAYATWAAGATHNANDVVKASNNNYYRFKTGGTSSEDPTSNTQNSWDLVIDASTYGDTLHGSTTVAANADEAALSFQYADTYMWRQDTTGVPIPGSGTGWANYWEELNESVIQSSQALGTVDLSEKLVNANFKVSLGGGLSSGLGNFFIGEGEGAVRIDYDINKDTVSGLIDRVNDSGANIHMYYDPVSDRFVIRNKDEGAVGIVLHESESYDTLNTINKGAGNMLYAMGLAAPVVSIYSGLGASYDFAKYSTYNNSTNYDSGDFVQVADGASFTYWQALQDTPSDDPEASSSQWNQIVEGVGRTLNSELGSNSRVTVNGGDDVYSLSSQFSENEHGYDGMYFDISGAAVNESATFTVAKDTSKAKNAINKFVEEFNDAQDYVKSLVSVTNDGENVTSGKFSSNIEISRLGSQLRKVVFGNSTPHSESGTTSDGADLIINDNTGGTGGTALANVKTQLQLGSNNSGYVVKVLKDTSSDPSGEVKYYKFDGTNWAVSTPAFSSFRLSSLGLDFGIGSDRLQVKNSALLTEALEDEPEKVQALFAEETVDSAFDLNSNSNRKYEGTSYAVDNFITSFLSGDSGSGYKGAYNTHIESIRSQNKRLDERIEDYESYIEQREKTLSEGFMRMEEMQSKLNTQLQTLQNSFKQS